VCAFCVKKKKGEGGGVGEQRSKGKRERKKRLKEWAACVMQANLDVMCCSKLISAGLGNKLGLLVPRWARISIELERSRSSN
jgi:hypothetical protein